MIIQLKITLSSDIYMGYLLFEVNTKYISSSELKNIRIFTSAQIYLVFAEKKANFLFILYNTRAFSYSQSRQ